ncbi:MAG: ATP synthase F1 subunit delta [Planctomycetes bacterium]|jgi:F-type H+-transporting ATPase subunit delta|nr:ATP synthase F1 subunit delta [Planctomycetota bacterium]MDP6424655.1 ATP synthase F1 subunit delta [Planctomycetota bacterium]
MASLTNRYTSALFDVALAEGSADAVATDLQVLGMALKDRQLRQLLENPNVEDAKKHQVLAALLCIGDREPHARTLAFLDVLLRRKRQTVLGDIVRAFRARALDVRGEVEGKLETALPLEAEDVARLQDALSSKLGKAVLLETEVVEDLLGGFRVRVADRMYDASLRGQLDALGRKLKGIPIGQLGSGAQ